VKESEYLTDAFTREAVQFIDLHSTDPFFLCLTYSAVHRPLQVTEQYYKRFAHIQDDRLRIYAAMVSAMDDGVGAILDKLKDKGLEKDTLLFFVSDNGAERDTESNAPLNTGKYHLFEGGIRIPFVVQWPGRIPAGKICSEPVSTLDIMPTAAAAANASLPSNRPVDGTNLLPYLTAETSTPPHDILFWRVGPNAAARKGRWKYVELDRERVFLFDLETDVGETRNMADDKPEIVAEMAEAIKNWETEMIEPLWSSRGNLTSNLSDYGLGEGTYRLFI
jgi:arylsulfatase A-like enzyme